MKASARLSGDQVRSKPRSGVSNRENRALDRRKFVTRIPSAARNASQRPSGERTGPPSAPLPLHHLGGRAENGRGDRPSAREIHSPPLR